MKNQVYRLVGSILFVIAFAVPGCGKNTLEAPPKPLVEAAMPPGEGATDITAENVKAMDQPADMDPKYEDKLQLTKNAVYPDDQDLKTGTIDIEVLNSSETRTIKTLVLSFQIMNGGRVVGHTTAAKLEYCPPSSVMRYSVRYNLVAVGRHLKAVVKRTEYAPEETVSWMVTEGFTISTVNEVVKVTGHAKNETGVTVHDIMVYGNFFNSRGQLLGSSGPVKLDDKTTLLKDTAGRFVIRFDNHKSIEEAKTADIRVVGKKS